MKYAVVIGLLLASFCTGCMRDLYRERMKVQTRQKREQVRRERRDMLASGKTPDEVVEKITSEGQAPKVGDKDAAKPDKPQNQVLPPLPPVSKSDLTLHPGRFSVGLSLGTVRGNGGEVIHDLRESRFGIGQLVGTTVEYMPAMRETRWLPTFSTRFAVEFRLENYSFPFTKEGANLGRLQITSGMFAFKFFQIPDEGKVFGFHTDLGIGIGTTFFNKGEMLRQDDKANGTYTQIVTETANIFEIGVGADFYLSPRAAVSLDFRHVTAVVPVRWSVDDVRSKDFHKFDAKSGQIVISFRVFF